MELQTFTSFQFCILLVWSANGDAPFQVNLLNDNSYLWNCAMSSYGQIRVRCALNMDIYMDTTTDHFTPLALRVWGKNGSHYRASELFSYSLKLFVFLKLQSQSKLNPNQIQIKSIPIFKMVLEAVCRDVTSGADRHLDIGLRVVESSSLVSVLFREVFSHPYIFFHLLANGFE